jgi:8-amino-7-oxononanoate synthase
MRDERTAIAANDKASERVANGLIPAVKRFTIRAGLSARTTIGEAAQAVADACAIRPKQTLSDYDAGAGSESFADLPAHRAIVKHRELGRLFSIADPFYRCHDARMGAETSIEGRRYVNFASYDYLGLNQHPAVAEAARAAIGRFGTSVSASRIVAGERPFHRGTLMTADDLILYDELSHNSVITGAKLSRATAIGFRHNDTDTLEALLREHRHLHKRALIAVEGLYSMDGDVADLPKLVALKEKYGAWLMVDEAHALGVLGAKGRGTAEHFGINPRKVDIWMGTLSKTLAACGGYIAGQQELIDVLKYQAPGLVYSVGLSPPLAAAASAALGVMRAEPERIGRVQANGKLFLSLAQAAGLDTATSDGHSIVSVIVGDLINAGKLSERLLARGLNVLPIIYPAVPLKAARFRFFITSEHTPAHIRMAVATIREELDGLARRRKAA